MAIIKGTTPTIIFTFSEVDVAHITTAFLVIKQNDTVIIDKPITDAVIGEDSIEWKLTQLETLSLSENRMAEVCCDWKLADGTRGRSNKIEERVEKAGKNGVI